MGILIFSCETIVGQQIVQDIFAHKQL